MLAELIAANQPCVGLTGAGVSTGSGIPDFRSPTGIWAQYDPYEVASIEGFQRDPERVWEFYGRRLALLADVQPNPAHLALAELEARGLLQAVITQNVDGLHQAAGSREVVELHGALARVRCLECGDITSRHVLQDRLLAANPEWAVELAPIAPDGDAELGVVVEDEGFRIVACERCDGVLMPDVVFFGGSVPRATLDAAWALFDRAELLLVAGSSLTVFSGYRFVRRAAERGVPVAIVNLGPTRGDPHAQLRIDDRCGIVLPQLARAFT